jgi:hypothetical protein
VAEIEDLARRVAAVEGALGMEHAPPLDRLSGIDHRLDSVRSLMQQQGLAIGDLARTLTRVEALHLEQSRRFDRLDAEVAEARAGIRAILDALTQRPDET